MPIKSPKRNFKSKINATAAQPSPETLAYRYNRRAFELFITTPREQWDEFFSLPEFATPMLVKSLGRDFDAYWDSDNLWDWRKIKKPTAEKILGRKLNGSSDVLHVWGDYYGKKVDPYQNLTEHLPFKADAIKISDDKPIPFRRVYTGQ